MNSHKQSLCEHFFQRPLYNTISGFIFLHFGTINDSFHDCHHMTNHPVSLNCLVQHYSKFRSSRCIPQCISLCLNNKLTCCLSVNVIIWITSTPACQCEAAGTDSRKQTMFLYVNELTARQWDRSESQQTACPPWARDRQRERGGKTRLTTTLCCLFTSSRMCSLNHSLTLMLLYIILTISLLSLHL